MYEISTMPLDGQQFFLSLRRRRVEQQQVGVTEHPVEPRAEFVSDLAEQNVLLKRLGKPTVPLVVPDLPLSLLFPKDDNGDHAKGFKKNNFRN